MPVYAFQVEIYVSGDSAQEAADHLYQEIDYHFGLDNNLLSAFFTKEPREVENS